MAAVPPWLAKFLGREAPADRRSSVEVRPGTVVLKPKDAPKPQGREITLKANGEVANPLPPRPALAPHAKQLTPAAMVYALAAGVLFTLAIYNLFHGSLFNGIVTLVPAGSLAVLAYKYIQ